MQWLFEIFESASDKARLITTLIAAAIAIAVVFVNQWFSINRFKKEKLIEKIEEYYVSIIEAQDLMSTRHAEIISNYDKFQPKEVSVSKIFNSNPEADKYNKINELHREFFVKIEKAIMLSSLYFPKLKCRTNEVLELYLEMHKNFISSERLQEYLDLSSEQMNKLEKLFPSIYNDLSNMMKQKIA